MHLVVVVATGNSGVFHQHFFGGLGLTGCNFRENFQDIWEFSDELMVPIYHFGCIKHIHRDFIQVFLKTR
jgi:hypothetical protein